jgi:hypothetical protein
MLVKDDRGSWYEDYHRDSVVDQESAEREGRGIIDYWNSTLHPGDRPREFVSVVLDAGDATRDHKWEKTKRKHLGRATGRKRYLLKEPRKPHRK